jgi:hypothetical protein
VSDGGGCQLVTESQQSDRCSKVACYTASVHSVSEAFQAVRTSNADVRLLMG